MYKRSHFIAPKAPDIDRLVHRAWIAHPECLIGQLLESALSRNNCIYVVGVFQNLSHLHRSMSRKSVGVALVAYPWPGCTKPVCDLKSRSPDLRIVALRQGPTQFPKSGSNETAFDAVVSTDEPVRRLIQTLANVLADEQLARQACPKRGYESKLPFQDDAAEMLLKLTDREREVLHHVALGKTASECAFALDLAPSTVENHKWNAMRKLNIHRTAELVQIAVRGGLLDE